MTHEELKKIREDKKLTKGEFAALIGISAMMQGRYEGGKIAIPEHIAEKALALGAAKAVKAVSKDKAKDLAKDAAKATVKKVVKDKEKKIAKDTKKKVAAGVAKAAVGIVAAEEVKKAAGTKKKADPDKKEEKKAEKKPAARSRKKKAPVIYIESMLGGMITADEILKRIPADAEAVYVKPGENKAYWVNGEQTGDVDLW